MKAFGFSRIVLFVLCGAGVPLVLSGLAFAGWVPQTSGTTNDLRSVNFPVDVQTGYAVGAAGTIRKTMNGGTSWGSQASGVTAAINSVHFPADAQTGYVAGAIADGDWGLIRKTTNGGGSWTIQVSGTITELRSIHFPMDAQTGYAAGFSLAFRKTTNGGGSWSRMDPGAMVHFSSVYFADAQTGYAVGAFDATQPVIVKTTNGGATQWVPQTPNATEWLYSVHFPADDQSGYIVGAAGTILKTTNGGGIWIPQTSGTASDLFSVHFPADAQSGFAVGAGGTILKTTNGGGVWFPQPSGTGNNLYSVHFPSDASTGYAVGAAGTILKTTDGGVGVEEKRGQEDKGTWVHGIKLTPNPFTSFAAIPGHESEQFALYDVSGKRVGSYRGERIGEGLSPGVYFLKGEGQSSKPLRVIKLR